MPTALVTGGSAGLGAAFACRLAADGYDLVLVARDRHRLEQVAAAHRRDHGVSVEVLAADLTEPAGLVAVERRLTDGTRPVDLLVNNAGVESDGEFVDVDVHDLQEEIDLNVTAVLRLTRAVLPAMIRRGDGAVVNVASFAGYLAASGSAYGATKAWVLAFTDTVAATLPGTGVQVIALCPGRLRSDEPGHVKQGRSALWLDPQMAVDRCLADLARGRTLSTPGLVYRAVVATLELPKRTLRSMARLVGRGREQRRVPRGTDTTMRLAG
ncbi:SDR family NAD(P)-dependent oxidoreductase [Pseudonocardia xinjiangensis]|uniref:SDR family NAD(P)-dependent oxidoreductase n=1 Tax=Pseudonocardia xinjiangensis TaxID=75289 RepID=UPI003D915E66